MTVAGLAITATDADSLMAIADALDEAEGNAGTLVYLVPAGDPDPEPPTPAAPALAVITPLFRCEACRDTGRLVKPSNYFPGKTIEGFCPACTPHFDFARRGFVNCGPTGAQAGEEASPPAPAPRHFDRAAHCQRIGQTGGMTTFARHGVAHMRAIGKAGYRAAVEAHGVGYVNGILDAKRWRGPRRPDLAIDLAAGRVLADLDRAA